MEGDQMQVTPYSFIPGRDFMWLGEYADGTMLFEFDPKTHEPCDFYALNRPGLIRFGLIGQGLKAYVEAFGGFFKIWGSVIQMVYKQGDKEYHLTGQPQMYGRIISYKEGYADKRFSRAGAERYQEIAAYVIGYKVMLQIEDIQFTFQAEFKLPFNGGAYMAIRLVADKDLNGELIIKRDASQWRFPAPLKKGESGSMNWVVV
jgi:hypothetical protein